MPDNRTLLHRTSLASSAAALAFTLALGLSGDLLGTAHAQPPRDSRLTSLHDAFEARSREAATQMLDAEEIHRDLVSQRVPLSARDPAQLLLELEARITALQEILVLHPRLLTRADLTRGGPPSVVDIVHSARYYRAAILDGRTELSLRMEAYAGMSSLPAAAAHIDARIRDAWLRDIRIATTERERETLLHAMRHVAYDCEVESVLLDFVRHDLSRKVRTAALTGLENDLDDTRVREVVSALARSDTSLRVRRDAARAIERWERRRLRNTVAGDWR